MREITVYTKPGCMQCRAVFRSLDKMGVPYRSVDISADADARDFVAALGYLQVPVVYTGADDHHSGFRPDLLARLAA